MLSWGRGKDSLTLHACANLAYQQSQQAAFRRTKDQGVLDLHHLNLLDIIARQWQDQCLGGF